MSSITSDYIQFIDIIRKNVYNVIHIPGSDWGGMAASNMNLFVGDKGSIHVLDHQGQPVRKIKAKSEVYTRASITICNSGSICYSDGDSLYCIAPDDWEVFTYISPDLRGTRGVTTDNLGNIYIVGLHSNNIHRLRPDGTIIDIILKEEDNIVIRIACCFSTNHRKLYVVNHNGEIISVFIVA